MKISGDFELQGALKNYGISNPNKYTSYHHGSSLPHANTINCDVTFNISDIKILSGNSEENQGVDRENHPSYVNVPVLMYIGGVRNG